VLQWAREQGCPWSEVTCFWGARGEPVHVETCRNPCRRPLLSALEAT